MHSITSPFVAICDHICHCHKQAHFRGQRVRRRLNEALRAAQFYDDEGEEEFDYDEEVDLTAFDFDESALEQGWTPSETPQLPSR